MHRRWFWVALLVAGCGSSPGETVSAGAFAGPWRGILSWTVDQLGTQYYDFTVDVRTTGDSLELRGLCTTSTGPTGKADGPATFHLDRAACTPQQFACGMVTFSTESGSGAMSGSSLSFGLVATISGCGTTAHVTAGFTGVKGTGPVLPDAGIDDNPDGGQTANSPPTAHIQSPAAVAPGALVTLDGSQSFDPEGHALSYQWTLVAPSGSAALLQDATAAVAHFTGDVVGTYAVQLTVSDGVKTASASATVKVATGSLTLLSFVPLDVEYDRPLDRVVAISAAPDVVHRMDPVTLDDQLASLPLTPRAVALSPDGLVAGVGHDAWVSVVDLSTMAVLHTWPITADVGDLVVSNPMPVGTRTTRFAYVFPSRDQWTAIHVIDLGNGAETTVNGFVYAGMRARQQPGTGHIFAIDPYLSPTQLYRWDIDPATGSVVSAGESPYWGDYPIGANIWVSDDGAQILSAGGTRFKTADMTYGGKTSVSQIAWADASTATGRWVVQPAMDPWNSGTTDDTVYWTYDTVYLANPERVEYPSYLLDNQAFALHGRYVFWNQAGTGLVVLAEVDAAAQLSSGWTLLRY